MLTSLDSFRSLLRYCLLIQDIPVLFKIITPHPTLLITLTAFFFSLVLQYYFNYLVCCVSTPTIVKAPQRQTKASSYEKAELSDCFPAFLMYHVDNDLSTILIRKPCLRTFYLHSRIYTIQVDARHP